MTVHLGSPWPLGSKVTERGVNFSVAAPKAKRVELLIFNQDREKTLQQVFKCNQSGDYWHIEIEQLNVGTAYSYRVFGEKNDSSNTFDSSKVLLDPCSRSIGGWNLYKRKSSIRNNCNIQTSLKSIVCERENFNFAKHPRPRHRWEDSVIYELHVGAFTNGLDSNINKERKGTFLGLIEKIPYLKELGVTTIELLPIYSFDPNDAPPGKENFWGYSPINWFTPHQNYVVGSDPLNARLQVREMVAACHDQGIEVLLDVVYNHTTEGDENGPIISWKGFGSDLYYHLDENGKYLDVTGCGNSIASNRPLVRKLILESMRCWASELGIDGFRFDLGIALSRGENLIPLENPPLFEEIEADPILSDLKLISEPWDCGGLYKLRDFPAKRIYTWNGKFRDNVRQFWKGSDNSTWPLKNHLLGSNNLEGINMNLTNKTVNFITAHDGFTLKDLVSFNTKHNFANGENNCDGENHNNSWNHGIEGPSSNHSLAKMRQRQQRNLMATLLLSPGVPMLLMGDEVGRSQGGNNNSWCQNSPLSWMIWSTRNCDINLKLFTRKLLIIRKQLSELFAKNYSQYSLSKKTNKNIDNDSLSIQWHGIEINKPDWSHWSHTISYSLHKRMKPPLLWSGLNAYHKPMKFNLPSTSSKWHQILNTGSSIEDVIPNKPIPWSEDFLELSDRSMAVMVTDEYASKLDFG